MTLNSNPIVAIIGAGAMGSGIAQVAALAHHPVIVIDASTEALERSRKSILGGMDKLLSRGKISSDERAAIEGRIRWTADIGDIAPAGLVIEAIVENMEAKIRLFARIAGIVGPDAILASNTSSLSINRMAAAIPGPQRFAGLHFFNPVPAMKLVEVVPGDRTSEAVTAALLAMMRQWGKVGVRVRDVPGFIVNRVARPYYAEGFAALGEGIDPAVIDHALESAGGFRMGPLALADMIGHDVNYVVARSVFDAYDGKTRFRLQPAQQALFEAGKLGRKSGGGVYEYGRDLPKPAFIEPGAVPTAVGIAKDHDGIAPIVAMMREAGLEIVSDATLPADSLKVDGIVIALGDGRLLGARADADVLLDHARDFATSPTWVITARNAGAARTAAALAHGLGRQAVEVPDRPGQIVLRTLAQLANAAADAVADDVASAADIDAAMRFGANHPEGPLAWAARASHERVAAALDAIAAVSGDALYRAADFFRQTESADR